MSAPPPAPSTPPPAGRWCFDDFELDIANATLHRAGQAVELTPKSFALLGCLVGRPGELVLKDELLDRVWQRRFVSEGAVKTVVSELRAALGDDARQPRWIETVPRRGYRFVGRLRPAAERDVPAPAPAPPRVGNLPPHLPPLIGRDAERDTLLEAIPRRRLVTLAGTAGVGKTRLALGLAQALQARFSEGAWLVELAALDAATTDAATLRASLALALQHPATAAASDATLARALAPCSLLLVLDNAEHLLPVLAPLVHHLREQAPGLHLLVTSREPLQLPEEQVFRLGSLALPPDDADADPDRLMGFGAVQFFVDRVAARLNGFQLGADHARATAQLCRALDGLPLALELAAARVPVLGVNGLAERLADDEEPGARLRLLTQGARTAAPHQRSLRAALDWSHALLTPAEQRVFRRLAVFRGSFTLASAQIVCADAELDAWSVLDALHALIEKSLLSATVQGPTGHRFTLLESVRAYAQEQEARVEGEGPRSRRLHLRAAVAYWAAADQGSLEAGALGWVQEHVPEVDNLRAALRWAQVTASEAASEAAAAEDLAGLRDDWLALVGHSGAVWHRAGLAAEGAVHAAAALDAARGHGDARRLGGVCLALASLAAFANAPAPPEGLACAGEAAQAYEAVGDAERAYYAHYLAWTLSLHCQRPEQRLAHMERLRALLQPQWSPMLQRFWRGCEAYERRLAGDTEAYLAYAREERALRRRAGAVWESWVAGHALALAECDRGDAEAAIAVLDEVLAEVRVAGRLHQNAARVSLRAAMVAQHRGPAAARTALSEAIPVLAGAGNLNEAGLPLAWLAWHEGRPQDAATLLAWHEGPRGAGRKYGPGTHLRRSGHQLDAALGGALDEETRRACRARGEALDEAEVVRLGLQAGADLG